MLPPSLYFLELLSFSIFFTTYDSGRAVLAAQYNTSAATSWTKLEADTTFSGRNGERIERLSRGEGVYTQGWVSQVYVIRLL